MMLGAISAAHHGWPSFPANGDSEVGVLTLSSSYVRFGMKSDKKVSPTYLPTGFILCSKRKLSECGHLEDMTFPVASLILSLL